jgi:hypothetical protein
MEILVDFLYFMKFMYNFDMWGWERGKCKNVYHSPLGLDVTIETESNLVIVSKNYNW